MFNWLAKLFSTGPKKTWVVELDSPGFVTSAELEKGSRSDDHSHRLILQFNEPVRDNNNVSHLNLGVNGHVINQHGLYSGDSAYSISINPGHDTLEIVTVDTDDQVVSREDLTMKQIPISHTDLD